MGSQPDIEDVKRKSMYQHSYLTKQSEQQQNRKQTKQEERYLKEKRQTSSFLNLEEKMLEGRHILSIRTQLKRIGGRLKEKK